MSIIIGMRGIRLVSYLILFPHLTLPRYLLDAIAGEKLHGNQLKQAAQRMHSPAAEQMYRQRQEEVFDISGDDEEFEQMYHEEQDNASKTKRQRPSPADTEDELLETAGVASKRFRED